MTLDLLTLALVGLPSSLTAALTCYIAYRQYLMSRHQVRAELFDRRFDVYSTVIDHFQSIFMDPTGAIDPRHTVEKKLARLDKGTKQAVFILDDELVSWINRVRSMTIELRNASPERDSEILIWFSDQYSLIDRKFVPYLEFRRQL